MLGERGQRALLEVRRQFLAENPDSADPFYGHPVNTAAAPTWARRWPG